MSNEKIDPDIKKALTKGLLQGFGGNFHASERAGFPIVVSDQKNYAESLS